MNNFYAYAQERTRTLMYRVFGWMSFALTLTGISAYYVASSPAILHYIFTHTWIVIGLILAQLALVFAISGLVNRLSFTVALGLFIGYATLTGITLSSLFVVYTMSSLAATFFVAAGMFGGMAIYGALTKTDLSGLGSILLMVLWGMILALIVNIFLQSQAFDYVISMVGVVVFSLLTAWDVQRIKALAQHDLPEAASVALALSLYLDFINLFIYLLRFMGQKRD